MPEAFAILAVFAVVVAAYVGASGNVKNHPSDSATEMARLKQQHAWLQQRLEIARREDWGESMTAQFTREIEVTARELAQRDGASDVRPL